VQRESLRWRTFLVTNLFRQALSGDSYMKSSIETQGPECAARGRDELRVVIRSAKHALQICSRLSRRGLGLDEIIFVEIQPHTVPTRPILPPTPGLRQPSTRRVSVRDITRLTSRVQLNGRAKLSSCPSGSTIWKYRSFQGASRGVNAGVNPAASALWYIASTFDT
jgi:hypothetical protein